MPNSQFEFPYDGFGAPSSANLQNGSADQAKATSVVVGPRKPSNRASERLEHEAKARSRAAGTKAQSEAVLPDPLSLDMRAEYVRDQYLSVRNVALRYDCSVPTIWRWGQRTDFLRRLG